VKRVFDIVISFCGITVLVPIFIVIAFLIKLNSKGSVFYIQKRVGQFNHDFSLLKFRTMSIDADKSSLLTVGSKDSRITSVGYFLRKYKLDELPQLINVLLGNMSLVGPRPEVRKYVDVYTNEQAEILNAKPGITDYASIEYFEENDLLAKSDNPEQTYIEKILPAKIALNKKYIAESGLKTDLKILYLTLKKIVTR
jgi:lipopolysaccharide/colanic/teichoic acid biosynthesis glycosyltransferase